MPFRDVQRLRFQPRGISDSVDSTNSFPGAMQLLSNLVPAQSTRSVMVPRPAATILTNFSSFTSPSQGEALFVQGTRVFGLIASGRNVGQSEPFCFDTATNAFVVVTGITAANTPTSIGTTGAWTPPTMAQIGSRIVVTHPGFDGSTHFFGWFDLSAFSDATHTGNTHTSTLVDSLSANVITAGWRPGMLISDSASDIPAGTTIVSIASNGLSLTLSRAATGSNTGTTFTVTGGTNSAPLWGAGDLTPNPIGAIPVSVAQFSGRAYYATKNAVVYSDSGDALLRTNATAVQAITFQNGLNVTALAGMPLDNQLGGVVQSLMAFQGENTIQQILGDQASNNLSTNQITESTGTLAPLTIVGIPGGSLLFIAADGLRSIDVNGNVSEPIGANGDGVCLPFENASNPSRMCGSYNEDVYRVSVAGNVVTNGQVLPAIQSVEYWYHVKLKSWSGPHSGPVLPARVMAASQTDTSSIIFSLSSGAIGLWESTTLPTNSSIYTENGTRLNWVWKTSLLPDNERFLMSQTCQTTVAIALGASDVATCVFLDDFERTLDSEQITGTTGSSLWGTMIWGVDVWGGSQQAFHQRLIPWKVPLVFKQGQLQITGPSDYTVRIGNMYWEYTPANYPVGVGA